MTALPWMKMPTATHGDDRLLRAARKGARELELWPWLLIFAGKMGDGGRLTIAGEPADPADIAAGVPGVKPARIAKCIESALAIGLLEEDDDGALRVAELPNQKKKPSDAPDAVRERVARHRAKRRSDNDPHGDAHPDTSPRNAESVTPGNAPTVTPVTPIDKRRGEKSRGEEKREEKSEANTGMGRGAAPASAAPPARPQLADLPKPVLTFLSTFYGRDVASSDRRGEVADQILASLSPAGARLKRGVYVHAKSPERLAARCREVLDEGVKDRDKAIVVLLTKLGDVTDLGPDRRDPDRSGPPGALREQLRAEEGADRAEAERRRAAVAAWEREHPDSADLIRARLEQEYPEQGPLTASIREGLYFEAAERAMQHPMQGDAGAEPHAAGEAPGAEAEEVGAC